MRLSQLVRLLVPTIGLGCAETPTEFGATPAGAEVLLTRISVSPRTLGPSDTAVLTLTSLNGSGRVAQFQSCPAPIYRVYSYTGLVDATFCASEGITLRLEPGDSLTRRTVFPVLHYVGGGYAPWPPGTYAFVAGWEIAGQLQAASEPVLVEITGMRRPGTSSRWQPFKAARAAA